MTGVLAGVDQRTQLAGQNRLELLLFRLTTGQRYGINVFKVHEVIHCPPLTQVPKSHPTVQGIASMRGKTIPVLDLSMAMAGPSLGDPQDCFVVITEYNCKVQGFLVRAVDRIVNLTWEEILPPPQALGNNNYMTAVTRVDDELVEVIDVEKILAEVMGDAGSVSEGIITGEAAGFEQHVLVVDDSSVARNQVKRVLDGLGVSYTTAHNGREGLEQLHHWVEEGRDLNSWLAMVISDVEMPQMDGYSLAQAIRGNPALEGLYVILHTSLSGVFNQQLVEKVGADLFVPKYMPDELTTYVQTRLIEHARKFSLAA